MKYNLLVENAVIFQNVIDQTRIIQNLIGKGFLRDGGRFRLSPYQAAYIKRFGDYVVDLSEVPPLDIEYTFKL